MLDLLTEMLGFLLLVLAAATVSVGLAAAVAGAGLLIFANRPNAKPKGPGAGPS